MQASKIITPVANTLNDAGHTAWTQLQVIDAINEGLRALSLLRPDALRETHKWELAAGEALQPLPTGYRRILGRRMRNMGDDGATPGRVILLGDKAARDAYDPTWMAATPATELVEFFYDEEAPDEFLVSPPTHAATPVWVEANLAKELIELTADTDPVPIKDVYQPPLIEYALYRLFARDSEETPNWQRAQAHLQHFYKLLGLKYQVDRMSAPKTKEQGAA